MFSLEGHLLIIRSRCALCLKAGAEASTAATGRAELQVWQDGNLVSGRSD